MKEPDLTLSLQDVLEVAKEKDCVSVRWGICGNSRINSSFARYVPYLLAVGVTHFFIIKFRVFYIENL